MNASSYQQYNSHFQFRLAQNISSLSKDNSTKVGAVLANSFGSIVSIGYNGLPRGMNDNDERYQNKTLPLTPANPFYKYDLFEHAERNCLYNFARTNTQLNHDDNYMIVSHISNAEEMRAIVSSGIKKVYFETINDDIVSLVNHVFNHSASERNISLHYIYEKDGNKFNTDNYSHSKQVKMFDALKNTYDKLGSCAIFNKNNALISIGVDGFSDYFQFLLNKKHSEKTEMLKCDKYGFYDVIVDGVEVVTNDSFNNDLSQFCNDFKTTSVQNCLYNLIANHIADKDYTMTITLPPCEICLTAMLFCGIKHVRFDFSSMTTTTSAKWQSDFERLKSNPFFADMFKFINK